MNDYVNKWKAALMTPKETFAAEKKNASVGVGIKHFVIAYAIAGALGGILAGPMGIIGGLVIGAIAGAIGPFIGTGILWIIAKVLGGKGEFSQQYYLSALFMPLIVILSSVPILGMIVGFLGGLYSLYLLTLSLKEVHSFSTMRAVAVWIIPAILAVILAFIIGAAILAYIGAAGLGALMQQPKAY